MVIIPIILLCLITLPVLGRIHLLIQFRKEVNELFLSSKNISGQLYNPQQLDGLPEPVQRYFKYALKPGQSYISYARIKHEGLFKPGLNKGWTKIKGEQYATTEKPGFIWKGTTSMFVARDMYIANTGNLVVSLFSLFKVVDGKGDSFNQGELLRWLGESVLYPTNLLPGGRQHWESMDQNTAKLLFNYESFSLFFIVRFNEIGEITQMETKRYMEKDKMETWIINMTNYKTMGAVAVPLNFDVLWRLEKADFSYARFNMTKIEYDKPELF